MALTLPKLPKLFKRDSQQTVSQPANGIAQTNTDNKRIEETYSSWGKRICATSFGSGVLGFFTMAYLVISQIMTVVFFIGYCRSDDSILEIIFLDSILSEIKGLLWIFFIW